MRRTWGLGGAALLLCGCGGLLFGGDGGGGDGDGDGDDDDGRETRNDGGDGEGGSEVTGWNGGDEGWDSENDSSPPTTGIEPTGADNELPEGDDCPCVADNEDIYVLSDLGTIWRFDPQSVEFTYITEIDCGGMLDTFSMGVSRKGRAWVQYQSGDLYTVDLKDPGSACKDPGFQPGNPLFPNFGMAFVADSADQTCDKLYAHSGIGAGVEGPDAGALGVIDPQTIVLSEIAKIDSGWGELTGTGDGRLFAFEGSEQTFLVEYDKDTAQVLGKWPLPGIENPSAFAFAFWGGDFYMFTTEPDDLVNGSHVVHVDFDGSDGDPMALTLLIDEAPLRIVGAGVSTCAPL